MPTLSPPFQKNASLDDEDTGLSASEETIEEDQETEEGKSDNGGFSTWKDIEEEVSEGAQDNGGGLSEWKTKRKRNGLKGRTPKHPLNERPYTC